MGFRGFEVQHADIFYGISVPAQQFEEGLWGFYGSMKLAIRRLVRMCIGCSMGALVVGE